MPRIAEVRMPAEPSSAEQRQRHQRILRTATRMGAAYGLERMQMHDVAREAGVAIATLYRYFPSKTHLFVGVLNAQIEGLRDRIPAPAAEPVDPVDAVAGLLNAATDELFAQPRLALAMLQANNAAHAEDNAWADHAERVFRELILDTARLEEPSEEHQQLARLVEQCWYGVLMSTLNNRSSREEARADISRACELLLAPLAG